MTDSETIMLPSPLARKMLPLSLLILALGFAGITMLRQHYGTTFIAMESSLPIIADVADQKVAKQRQDEFSEVRVEVKGPPTEIVQSEEKSGENRNAPVSVATSDTKSHQTNVTKEEITNTDQIETTTNRNQDFAELDISNGQLEVDDPVADILAQFNEAIDSDGESVQTRAPPVVVIEIEKPDLTDVAQIDENVQSEYIVIDDFVKQSVATKNSQAVSDSQSEANVLSIEKIQISRAMLDAVDSGAVEKVSWLIKQGEFLDAVNSQGETALLKAAWNGDILLARKLLEMGADISIAADDGRTPLFSAAISGNFELVNMLLQRGANVNASTNSGKTPLMVSAWSDYSQMTKLLLRNDADPDLIDNNGRSAIFYALWDRNVEVVRSLLEHGASLAMVDKQGHSTRDIARMRRIILPGMEINAPE